jgi:hypothetical protein
MSRRCLKNKPIYRCHWYQHDWLARRRIQPARGTESILFFESLTVFDNTQDTASTPSIIHIMDGVCCGSWCGVVSHAERSDRSSDGYGRTAGLPGCADGGVGQWTDHRETWGVTFAFFVSTRAAYDFACSL